MYEDSNVLYQRWANLTSGASSDNATQIITQDLHSSIVLVATDHPAFDATMRQQKAFTLVYQDSDAKIYELTSVANGKNNAELHSTELP